MKVTLDHIGIAVKDVDQALAFFRDALGLDVLPPEIVASQAVRAHLIPAGEAALELLEGTESSSAISRFVDKRGPGIHHVTLRVDDIRAALAQLKSRGVRLVDDEPRAGAGGSLIAFVHPSAAHGVLVELKQTRPGASSHATSSVAGPAAPTLTVKQMPFGDVLLTTLHDGPLKLDGGAMFGVVPRVLWEKRMPADDRHRIQLTTRPLLVEASWGRMIIDAGTGDKGDAKFRDIFGLDPEHGIESALAAVGLSADAIDFALPTHLHFDHFGAATMRRNGALVPRFAKARHLIRAAEWEDATHPHERNRASYLQDDILPLQAAGVIDFFEHDHEVKPGIRVVRSGGHTCQHQVIYVESAGRTAVFPADMVPTTHHLQDPWVTGFDLLPVESLQFKKRFLREAIDREYLVFFEHDPHVAAGYIRERDGKRFVEQVL